ncbi:PilZ domain-containing protein [Bacillus solitudinis]|uniref:PilZ domain-containing protein n=1 Tax=Bacillus solitudinis TaxID=2014074 RepID=UPI000C23C3AF|nr:PilZ domain-containing protein [Bacillus solitudinis]
MRHRRSEAFRFLFEVPISAFFSIIEVNGKLFDTSEGKAQIIDLSPNGMKLNTSLRIPISEQNKVKISVRFSLNENEYLLIGRIVWSKEQLGELIYGIHLSADTSVKQELMEELKLFSRSLSNKCLNN